MTDLRTAILIGLAAIMSATSISLAFAVQPVSDEVLAETMSENTIIFNEKDADNQIFRIEQDIAMRDTPAYQSLDQIYMLYPITSERVSGEQKSNLTQNFGSEFYSYRWQGNLADIWDKNQYYRVSYNSYIGDYELHNVQGQVSIESTIHCTTQNKWRGC